MIDLAIVGAGAAGIATAREVFFGGDWVGASDPDSLEALAREELGHWLGASFGARMRRIAASGWKDDPRIGGSYSFARPGEHCARSALAAAIDGPLAFAGEACSSADYSTVHGAWQSGIAAVAQVVGEIAYED